MQCCDKSRPFVWEYSVGVCVLLCSAVVCTLTDHAARSRPITCCQLFLKLLPPAHPKQMRPLDTVWWACNCEGSLNRDSNSADVELIGGQPRSQERCGETSILTCSNERRTNCADGIPAEKVFPTVPNRKANATLSFSHRKQRLSTRRLARWRGEFVPWEAWAATAERLAEARAEHRLLLGLS